ncbi:lysozyme P-like [Rhodnius prolixus]|uniref:lysozyme n=1 Tax=Rhodnius prolixus TaxID=13249 RepID=A0A4P6DBW4_RHOPR
MKKCITVYFASLFAVLSWAKVYERCELVRELLEEHKAPRDQLSTWVCIVEHESQYNTSAVGRLSSEGTDHGLFQISSIYWCSPPGHACAISCDSLEDDDITDDWRCAKRIYRQHKYLSGNGFTAWAVYRPHCSSNTEKYLEGCFNETNINQDIKNVLKLDVNNVPTESISEETSTPDIK